MKTFTAFTFLPLIKLNIKHWDDIKSKSSLVDIFKHWLLFPPPPSHTRAWFSWLVYVIVTHLIIAVTHSVDRWTFILCSHFYHLCCESSISSYFHHWWMLWRCCMWHCDCEVGELRWHGAIRRLYKQVQEVYEERGGFRSYLHVSPPLSISSFTLCGRGKRNNSSPALLYQPVIFRGLNYDNN